MVLALACSPLSEFDGPPGLAMSNMERHLEQGGYHRAQLVLAWLTFRTNQDIYFQA